MTTGKRRRRAAGAGDRLMRLRFGPGLPASGLVRRPGGPGARLDCGARLDSGARLDCGARLDSGARLDCGAPCPALDRVG